MVNILGGLNATAVLMLQRGAEQAYSAASQQLPNAGLRMAQGGAAESSGAAGRLGAAAVAAERGTSAAPLYIMQVPRIMGPSMLPDAPYEMSVTDSELQV